MGHWGAGRWMQCRQATVNFKEFLQDIFINFFSWLFLEKGVGEGSRWAGLGFVLVLALGSFYIHTYIYLKNGAGHSVCSVRPGRSNSSPMGATAQGPSTRSRMGTHLVLCLRTG